MRVLGGGRLGAGRTEVRMQPIRGRVGQGEPPAPPQQINQLRSGGTGAFACRTIFPAWVTAALLFTCCLRADDWPQFRGNPSLTGIATSAVPKTLKLLWTFEAGDSIESSAAIVDGT